MAVDSPGSPSLVYHATTPRAAQRMWDSEQGLHPAASERFAHAFLFDRLSYAQAFVARYPGNFPEGAVILEFLAAGLPLEPDPQQPPLAGAWRCADPIGMERCRAEINPETGARHPLRL